MSTYRERNKLKLLSLNIRVQNYTTSAYTNLQVLQVAHCMQQGMQVLQQEMHYSYIYIT